MRFPTYLLVTKGHCSGCLIVTPEKDLVGIFYCCHPDYHWSFIIALELSYAQNLFVLRIYKSNTSGTRLFRNFGYNSMGRYAKLTLVQSYNYSMAEGLHPRYRHPGDYVHPDGENKTLNV